MAKEVLIVDDEPGIRDTLRGVLEDEGFAVDRSRRVKRVSRPLKEEASPAYCSTSGSARESTVSKR